MYVYWDTHCKVQISAKLMFSLLGNLMVLLTGPFLFVLNESQILAVQSTHSYEILLLVTKGGQELVATR